VTGVPRTALRRTLNVPMIAAAIAGALAVAALAVHLHVRPLPLLTKLDGITVDARFRWRGARAPATDRVVIVGIDDKTRAEAPDVIQTRHGFARLIRALGAAEPAVIALDMYIAAPEIILPDALARDVRGLAGELAAPSSEPRAPLVDRSKAVVDRIVYELEGDADVAAAVKEARTVFLGAHFWLARGAAKRPAEPEPPGLARATSRSGAAPAS